MAIKIANNLLYAKNTYESHRNYIAHKKPKKKLTICFHLVGEIQEAKLTDGDRGGSGGYL